LSVENWEDIDGLGKLDLQAVFETLNRKIEL
jgi:hypothetical protein